MARRTCTALHKFIRTASGPLAVQSPLIGGLVGRLGLTWPVSVVRERRHDEKLEKPIGLRPFKGGGL